MSEPFPSLIVQLTAHDRLALRRALSAELTHLAEALDAGRDWRIRTGVRRWEVAVSAYAGGALVSREPVSVVAGEKLSAAAYAVAEAMLVKSRSYDALDAAKASLPTGAFVPWGMARQAAIIKQIGSEEWDAFYDLVGDPGEGGVSDRWQALKASGAV